MLQNLGLDTLGRPRVILTSSTIDKKLEIYTKLEIELEINKNLEYELEIDKNLENFESNFEFYFDFFCKFDFLTMLYVYCL